MIKLSDWAKKNNINYNTALRWFKNGKLPVSARQIETGTILIDEDCNINTGTMSNEAHIFLSIYNSLSNELVYIVNNDNDIKAKLIELANMMAKSQHTILSTNINKPEFTKQELYNDFINIMEKSLDDSLANQKQGSKVSRVGSSNKVEDKIENNDLVKVFEDIFVSASHDEENKNIKTKIVNGYEIPTDPSELTNIPLSKEKLDELDEEKQNKKILSDFIQSFRSEYNNNNTKERTKRFQNKETIARAGEFKRAKLNYDEHSESVLEFARIICEKAEAIKFELTLETTEKLIKNTYTELTDMHKDSYSFDMEFINQIHNILTCGNNKDSLQHDISSNTKVREVLLFVFDYPKIQLNMSKKKAAKQELTTQVELEKYKESK